MNTTITLPTDVAAALRQALNDAVLVPDPSPAPAPSPTPAPIPVEQPYIPLFVAPAGFTQRVRIVTHAEWQRGAPSFYSGAPLNDSNIWLIGFTAGIEKVSIGGAEYGGSGVARRWAIVDNETGATIASNSGVAPTPTFSIPLNGTPSRFDVRYVLVAGRRYTLAVWNAYAGASSPMVGQFYF